MGRKKIQKMVEIIININNKIIKIPVNQKLDDKTILSLNDSTKEIYKNNNDDQIKQEKDEDSQQKKESIDDFFKPNDFSSDFSRRESENEFDDFINEMDDIYFNIF